MMLWEQGPWSSALLLLLAYLLGTLNPGYLLTRYFLGQDIRDQGSGNAGATNALRVLGRWGGVGVLCFDAAKGFLAASLPGWCAHSGAFWAMAAGTAAVLGHIFPVFLSFRGGKGVATTLGLVLALDLRVAGWMLAVAVLVILIKRYVSLGALCALAILPLLLFLYGYGTGVLLLSGLLVAVGFWRHRVNILALLRGKERCLTWKR